MEKKSYEESVGPLNKSLAKSHLENVRSVRCPHSPVDIQKLTTVHMIATKLITSDGVLETTVSARDSLETGFSMSQSRDPLSRSRKKSLYSITANHRNKTFKL